MIGIMKRLIFPFFVLFGLTAGHAPLAYAAREVGDAARYYEEALQVFETDVKTAIILLKNALDGDPNNVTARILLGRAQLRVRAGAEAEKELSAALQQGADMALIALPLSRAYLLQGKHKELLQNIPDSGYDPDTRAKVLVNHGRANIELRNYDGARRNFEDAIRLRPKSPAPVLGLARVYMIDADFAAANEAIEKARSIDPDNVDVRFLRGELERYRGKLSLAIAAYDEVIERSPRHGQALIGRAMARLAAGDNEAAVEDVAHVRRLAPGHVQAAYVHALILAQLGRSDEATQALNDADLILRRYDKEFIWSHASTLMIAGLVNYAKGSYDVATGYIEQFVRLEPKSANGRKLLGRLLILKPDAEAAVAALEPAVKLKPNDAELLSLLGSALLYSGRAKEAAEILKRAAELAPDLPAVRTALAQSRLIAGATDEAVEELESIFADAPDDTRAGLMLGMLHLRHKRFDDALRVTSTLAQRNPAAPQPHVLEGVIRVAKGDRPGAVLSFEEALKRDSNYYAAKFNLARLEESAGNVEAARERYLSMAENGGNSVEPIVALADLAEKEGKHAEVVAWLAKAVGLNRDNRRLQRRLTYARIRAGDTLGAMEQARRLIASDGEDLDAYEALAHAQMAADEATAARATFRRMAAKAFESARWLHRVAKLQSEIGDNDGADTALRRALFINPGFVPAQIAMVEHEARTGRLEEALSRAEKLREKYPKAAVFDQLIGDALMTNERPVEAAEAYVKALEKEQNTVLVVRHYLARRAAGHGKEYIGSLERWVRDHPNDDVARRTLGGAYIDARRKTEAIAEFETLLARLPDDAFVLNNLASLYDEAGNDRGRALAEKARAIAPKNALVLDTLGWILVRDGEVEQGLTLLREAYTRASREQGIRYHIAFALVSLSRPAEARQLLRSVLETADDPDLLHDAKALLEQIGE